MKHRHRILKYFSIMFVLAILPIKLYAFEVIEITESYVKGKTTLPFRGQDYEIVLTLQAPDDEKTTFSAIWYIPKDAVSIRYPISSELILPKEEINSIVKIYEQVYNCSLETSSNLVSTLSEDLKVKSSGSILYNQKVKNFFTYGSIRFFYHTNIENIVFNSVPSIRFSTSYNTTIEIPYRISPFLGVDMTKLTIYVPYGSKEEFIKLPWLCNAKAIIECDPEEKWQELIATEE